MRRSLGTSKWYVDGGHLEKKTIWDLASLVKYGKNCLNMEHMGHMGHMGQLDINSIAVPVIVTGIAGTFWR